MRSRLRRTIFLALRLTLLPLVIREVVQRKRVTIIAYHDPSPTVFDAHVSILKHIYNIVSLSVYIDSMQQGTVSTLPPKALVITLDDGHRSNFALKAVIDRHKVPVTIFLCSGLIDTHRRFWFLHEEVPGIVQQLKAVPDEERLAILRKTGFEETREFPERQALSAAEVGELKTRVDFQSHSVFHPILPRCAAAKAEFEIRQSRDDLRRALAIDVYAFAYPNGEYSERELRLLEKAGYRCGLTLDLGFNSDTTPPFRLRRICLPDSADRHELIVKASGVWGGIQAILGNGSLWRRGSLSPRRSMAHVDSDTTITVTR